jgi:dienelactone hydrolase
MFSLTWPEEPGRIVRGRVTLPAGSRDPAPFVILLHGFKGFMDWGFFPELARRIAGAGFAAVAFNTSGSGIGESLADFTEEEAFAKATYTQQLEDIERVRERVAAGAFPGVDPDRGGLFGHSRGGAMAIVHAAERGDYRAVVTWAAMDSALRFDPATRDLWRRQGHIPVVNARTGQTLRLDRVVLEDAESGRERFDVLAAAARLAAPTLLVHGTADESVDARALDRIASRMGSGTRRVLRLEGAGHTLGARHPLVEVSDDLERACAATVAWFREHLRAS